MPVSEPHVPAPATKWVMRPGRLAPQLGPRRLLVGGRVVRVGVLVGAERVELVGQSLGDLVVALRVVGRDGHRAHDDFGAVRASAATPSRAPSCRSSRTRTCSRVGRRRSPDRHPVLPLVGSTIVPPGRSDPSRSAARIISSAGRSFDEPPGFVVSIFMASTQGSCSTSIIRRRRTIGVLPISSVTESAISVPSRRGSAMRPSVPLSCRRSDPDGGWRRRRDASGSGTSASCRRTSRTPDRRGCGSVRRPPSRPVPAGDRSGRASIPCRD